MFVVVFKSLAVENNALVTDDVPKEAWLKLLNEKNKLMTIRNELELMREQSNAVQSNTNVLINDNIVDDDDEVIQSSATFETLDKPKASKKQKKKVLNTKHERIIDDIVGVYYCEQHMVNEIKEDYSISVFDTKAVLSMHLKDSSDRNLIELECVLVDDETFIVDDPKIAELCNCEMNEFQTNSSTTNSFVISCKLDVITGELIWDSGVVWFKKEWKILSGAWEDSSSHMIEILPQNQCRFIGGYGPFLGEFTGFKRLQILLPNEHFLMGNLVSSKIIEWEHENGRWVKIESKGCLIM